MATIVDSGLGFAYAVKSAESEVSASVSHDIDEMRSSIEELKDLKKDVPKINSRLSEFEEDSKSCILEVADAVKKTISATKQRIEKEKDTVDRRLAKSEIDTSLKIEQLEQLVVDQQNRLKRAEYAIAGLIVFQFIVILLAMVLFISLSPKGNQFLKSGSLSCDTVESSSINFQIEDTES